MQESRWLRHQEDRLYLIDKGGKETLITKSEESRRRSSGERLNTQPLGDDLRRLIEREKDEYMYQMYESNPNAVAGLRTEKENRQKIYDLMRLRADELEEKGITGRALARPLISYYFEAKERINTGVVAHVQEKEYDSGWFD